MIKENIICAVCDNAKKEEYLVANLDKFTLRKMSRKELDKDDVLSLAVKMPNSLDKILAYDSLDKYSKGGKEVLYIISELYNTGSKANKYIVADTENMILRIMSAGQIKSCLAEKKLPNASFWYDTEGDLHRYLTKRDKDFTGIQSELKLVASYNSFYRLNMSEFVMN